MPLVIWTKGSCLSENANRTERAHGAFIDKATNQAKEGAFQVCLTFLYPGCQSYETLQLFARYLVLFSYEAVQRE